MTAIWNIAIVAMVSLALVSCGPAAPRIHPIQTAVEAGATVEDLQERFGDTIAIQGNEVTYRDNSGDTQLLSFEFVIPTRADQRAAAQARRDVENDNLPFDFFEGAPLSGIPTQVVTAMCTLEWRTRIDPETGRTEYNPCHMPEVFSK